MNEIDYQGLSVSELRTIAGKVAYELDRRRTLAETPARIAALYQLIEDAGGDTKQAEATITAERAVLATEAARARADGDLFQVEDTEAKPVERIELDDA